MYQKGPHLTPYRLTTLIVCSLMFLAAYLWVFWPSLAKMESIWRHSETYMHAYLILPISLWLIWRRRDKLTNLSVKPTVIPALLAIPFAILWLLAYAIDVNFVSQFSAIFYLQLLIWSLLGHQVMRVIWFPIAFLVFLVPFGEAANPVLQQVTADIVVYFLRIVDFPVYREGLYLFTPSAVFEVADACSGLNFLLTSLVLSCLYSHLHYSKAYKAFAFILLTLVLSIIGNGIRAFLLVVIGEKTKLNFGFGADHYYYGWLVFFIVIMLAFWIGAKFADEVPPPSNTMSAAKPTSGLNKMLILCLSLTFITAGYISRNIQETIAPAQPAHLVHATSISESSNWGIQFFDGMTRDHWITDEGIELFIASYAHRQDRGDMITWHNTLYQPEHWSITEQYDYGSLLDGHRIVHLVNSRGQQRVMLYWYQLADHKTSNRIAIKLLQLLAMLKGDSSPAYIYAVSIAGNEPAVVVRQQLLQAKHQQLSGIAE